VRHLNCPKRATGLALTGIVAVGFAAYGVIRAEAAPSPALTHRAATETPTLCDVILFMADITVPDGSPMEPGVAFTKTWRLQNGGTCTWTTAYSVVFVDGDQMGAPGVIGLPTAVGPGQIIDVSVEMTAPSANGHYRGNWMLRNAAGVLFGCGDDAAGPFFIDFYIGPPVTETVTETATPTDTVTATVMAAVTETAAASEGAGITRGAAATPPSPSGQEGIGTSAGVAAPTGPVHAPPRFRDAGPLIPEITTSIPTPLDVSTEPGVVGTNLLLAAAVMLPFAWAAESLTRMLAENEEALPKRFRLTEWISRLQGRLAALFPARRSHRPAWRDVGRLLSVTAFYGIAFSLLDRTWNPLTLKGLVLFLSMAVAYGVVGIADDIVQWRAIRRWELPAELSVRPANVLLAVTSTTFTRVFSLVPGLMFGTPEALRVDEGALDQEQRDRLLKISVLTFASIGLCTWMPTIVTSLLLRTGLSGWVSTLLGGFEGFLLVVFAVALENLFVQLLGFPGGFGRPLKRKNRWLWLGVLIGVAFLFLHTLLNPRGELAEALQEGNVIVFLSVAAVFVCSVFMVRLISWQRERRRAAAPRPDASD
jgi:hypothetical protein